MLGFGFLFFIFAVLEKQKTKKQKRKGIFIVNPGQGSLANGGFIAI